ncbi:hypothetical protein L6452_44810 [Arctium lappa]|nr:hypothetical protein L6452_46631 [Arctium lappa]KAI3662959.1 hypothetical protein L6452_46632 [Arctium lappa]KAI3664205.1 hypothetical protein L6452_44808 [Arctium lappa]KAI3664206.1 hypothetical protein L6452_44809 [Arctium lappa]KAI3664207.1 hypothetical protein L6452_44810 [Arctium lappa]
MHESNSIKSTESFGREYFEELVSRSFFQHSADDISRYVMHDLINDVDTSVRGEFFCTLDDKVGHKASKKVTDYSFDRLTELTLRGYRSCTYLPMLGHLQSLQKLFVVNMNEVNTLGIEFLASTNSFHGIAFPFLEVLQFHNTQGWEKWSTSGGDNDRSAKSFPRLHEISIDVVRNSMKCHLI